MATQQHGWPERRFEMLIGQLLRIGVMLSATIVFAGGVHYLFQHQGPAASFPVFRGEPDNLRHVSGILEFAMGLHSRGFIQLGLLILIATPIARVAFSVIGFSLERDWLYVGVTLIVLALLVYSLAFS
jgi:uncharacterized membrane protein